MSKCMVNYCMNRIILNGVLTLPPGVSYHRLPKEPILRDKWKDALRIRRPTKPKEFVCSSHFKINDFREGIACRRLKPGAVPTLDANTTLPTDKRQPIFTSQLVGQQINLYDEMAENSTMETIEELHVTHSKDFEITFEEMYTSQNVKDKTTVSENSIKMAQLPEMATQLEPVRNVIVRQKVTPTVSDPVRTSILPASQCRVCSFDSPYNERLFEENGTLSTAGKNLRRLISVNLCPGDGFPNRICRPCNTQLKLCAAFQDTALQMQQKFQEKLDSVKPVVLESIQKSPMSPSVAPPKTAEVVTIDLMNDGNYFQTDWERAVELANEAKNDELLSMETDFPNQDQEGQDNGSDGDWNEDIPKKVPNPSDYAKPNKLRNINQRPWIGPKLCPGCMEEFNEQQKFIDHVKMCIPKPKKNRPASVCGECGITFGTFKQAEDHVCGAIPERCKNMVWCPVCQKDVTKGQYKIHRVRHSDLRPFECTQCPKRFKFNCDLRTHMDRHTDIRRFVCEVCGAAFRQTSHYREHQEMHTGQILTCIYEGCTSQFRTRKALNNHHMAKHERKIVCEICGLGMPNNFRLKEHMKMHERNGRTVGPRLGRTLMPKRNQSLADTIDLTYDADQLVTTKQVTSSSSVCETEQAVDSLM